jgi:D-glycero-D-manno-heptose 1,7-bisphosphate phosphatase
VSRPAVLVDRDGVIVKNRDDYVKSLEEMEILPGAIEALAALSKRGHRVFVITNQSAIGRGLTTRAEVDRMHAMLSDEVRDHGGTIEAFLVCPHTPEDHCDCRKPAPGLLYQARDRYQVDLGSAVVIGDARSDIQAAQAAGCRSILVLTGVAAAHESQFADRTVSDLSEAAKLVLASI